MPGNHAYGSKLDDEIKILKKKINLAEYLINNYKETKRKLDSGKYYVKLNKSIGPVKNNLILQKEYLNKLDNNEPLKLYNAMNLIQNHTKNEYNRLLYEIKEDSRSVEELKKTLTALEKKENQRHQEGYAYIEARVNRERYSQPRKNLHRWDWQIRFDETNGVGVKIYECWERGYRGSTEEVKRRTPMNVYVSPYVSAFIDTVFMQYSTYHDKTRSGTMKFIYNGIDDNGNKVKTELLELTRFPPK